MSTERVYLRDGRLVHAETIHRPKRVCRQEDERSEARGRGRKNNGK